MSKLMVPTESHPVYGVTKKGSLETKTAPL